MGELQAPILWHEGKRLISGSCYDRVHAIPLRLWPNVEHC